jgi:hypothetical protein
VAPACPVGKRGTASGAAGRRGTKGVRRRAEPPYRASEEVPMADAVLIYGKDT